MNLEKLLGGEGRAMVRELLFVPQPAKRGRAIPQSVVDDMLVEIARLIDDPPGRILTTTRANTFEEATSKAREATVAGFGTIIARHENHWGIKAVFQ